MTSFLDIILLSIVQGLTEFLPVSSSGHLNIASALLRSFSGESIPQDVLEVNITLHVGTLFAVIVYYWQAIWKLLGDHRALIGKLLVGTIPAVMIGLPLKKLAPQFLESPLVAGCLLPITGLVLLWSVRIPVGERQYDQISYRTAFLIGVFQGLAVLPGISRSGATIVGGLLFGLRRKDAAVFAFLLAIPAISGAGILELREMLSAEASSTPWPILLTGLSCSFIVGLAALWWLVRLLERGSWVYFAYWCIPLGLITILWQVWV